MLDEERPLIAGVYQNRLDRVPAVKHGAAPVRPDEHLRRGHRQARARCRLEDWVEVHVLDGPRGRQAPGRQAARRARGVQHLHRSRACRPARSPRPRSRRSRRRWTRTRRPATRSSSRRATATGTSAFAKTKAEHDKKRREVRLRSDLTRRSPSRPTSRRRRMQRARARWRDAERSQLPGRLERLRARMAAEGVEGLLRREARAHALADRVHPGRWRGEGGRALRPAAGRARGRRARHGLPVHDPGAPRGAGRGGRRDRLRPRGLLAAARGAGRGPSRGRRGRRRLPRAVGTAGRRGAGRGAGGGRRLDRGDAGRQEPRRDRADRGGLRGGRSGAGGVAAGDPGRGRPSTTWPCASSG